MIKKALDRDFQRKVVERDGRCVICGSENIENLGGHHLVKRKYNRKRIGNRRLQDFERSRWDMRCGVSLCWIPCHVTVEQNPAKWEPFLAYERPGAQFESAQAWMIYKNTARGMLE